MAARSGSQRGALTGLWAKRSASLYELVTFDWISPLLAQGAKGLITERSAEAFLDNANRAPYLMAQFQSACDAPQVLSLTIPSLIPRLAP